MTGKCPEILIVVPYYLPGYKAGGPIRTISAMVEKLRDEFSFLVVTSDRDKGDQSPYTEASEDEWVTTAHTRIRYLSPEKQSLAGLQTVLAPLSPQLIYLNAFYHPVFTFRVLLLRKLGIITDAPVLLAPRGQLSSGSRSVKPWRKRCYIGLVKSLGLMDDTVFHASDKVERREILEVFPKAEVLVVPNMYRPIVSGSEADGISASAEHQSFDGAWGLEKKPGELRAVFLSRIAREKNLDGCLQALSAVEGHVQLSIVGPVVDTNYWEECKSIIDQLPKNVSAHYWGPVSHREVPNVLTQHHILFLPSRSESFGHVIRESLELGLPVLIGDRTPWTEVEVAGAGWTCPPRDLTCLRDQLSRILMMGQGEFEDRCDAARCYWKTISEGRDAEDCTRSMLNDLICGSHEGSSA